MYGLSFGSLEMEFSSMILLSLVLGFAIGAERESRGKDAGISTHILVITGAALFSVLSSLIDPASTSRIAAQIVTGIGFLGAGLIIRDGVNVKNLTTAASLWVAAGIGMAIGFGFYSIAIIAGVFALITPRIPHFHRRHSDERHEI